VAWLVWPGDKVVAIVNWQYLTFTSFPRLSCISTQLFNSSTFHPQTGGESDTMDMAMSRVGSTQASIKDVPAYQIVDLSDNESENTDALAGVPRVNGVKLSGLQDLDASDDGTAEGSDDEWDVESVFEETLGEMDDQHLFEGGEYPETRV
jgi:hypothetical protein